MEGMGMEGMMLMVEEEAEGRGGRRRVTVWVTVMREQVEAEEGRMGVGRGSEIVMVVREGVGTGREMEMSGTREEEDGRGRTEDGVGRWREDEERIMLWIGELVWTGTGIEAMGLGRGIVTGIPACRQIPSITVMALSTSALLQTCWTSGRRIGARMSALSHEQAKSLVLHPPAKTPCSRVLREQDGRSLVVVARVVAARARITAEYFMFEIGGC